MASFIRRLFGGKKKKAIRKDSITGRSHTWPTPYLSKLEGTQLQPGQSLIVRGVVTGVDRFDINLTTGPNVEGEPLDNVVLHVGCRLKEKKVVLNSYLNGEWEKEKRVRCPFKSGEEFDYRIRAHENHFEVFIEHKLVAKFEYRLPLNAITHLFINGDIELYAVSWEGKYYTVPYAADIPGNFYPGRKLFVSGITTKKSKEFIIDLHSGNDIAFHFDSRFKDKVIVRNTQSEGNWGKEERDGEFPCRKKRNCDVIIYCDEAQFKCYVDGALFCVYNHRMSPRNIDKLSISGDIELQGVHLK
uniref:Galectin n=1 Tax=Plectus sambesii TaxID=2011161 RepID=A0A914VHL7_9BILA